MSYHSIEHQRHVDIEIVTAMYNMIGVMTGITVMFTEFQRSDCQLYLRDGYSSVVI